MPLYEYNCKNCNEIFEFLIIDSDEDVHCPSCESHNLEKLFSTFGLQSNQSSITNDDIAPRQGCCGSACGCGVKN